MEYPIRIGFKATNNEVEYEALLTKLKVATELEMESLDVYNNSQFVVNQVKWDYISKDLPMLAYFDEANTMAMKIKIFRIRQIHREENM